VKRGVLDSIRSGALLCVVSAALSAALSAVVLAAGPSAAREGVVRFDFENGNAHGWRAVEGDLKVYLCPRVDTQHLEGKGHLRTDHQAGSKSDGFVGVLESPVFVLTGRVMKLRVGGGKNKATYVALCTLGGKEVLKARGRNSVAMQQITWDVSKLVGKKVFMRIHDGHRGGWGHVTLDDVTAGGKIDPAATKQHFATRKKVLKATSKRKRKRPIAAPAPAPVSGPDALRAAIKDLAADFGGRYPKGKEFLARLDAIERRLGGSDAAKARADLGALQREALIANPLVSEHGIVFVVRAQYPGDHHNTATMFQTNEINTGKFRGPGALKKIHFGRGGEVTTLLEVPKGVARDPEVGFDGRRIVFAMRRDVKDDYHIYEIYADGAGLKQLTFGKEVSDIDPMYLPDGRIAFGSTREPKYCMCNRHIMCNLFRMDADGANMTQIGHSTLHEGHATLTPDGRILYDRWEYVDRNFGDAQGVWVCNPDGTNHAVYWGNNTKSPGAVLDTRVIPGQERFIATFSSCHDRPWGALAIVDRSRGIDKKEPVIRTWPASAMNMVMKGNYDMFTRTRPKYEDPYPLADAKTNAGAGKYFLCARQVKGEQVGIFLIDTFGNEILLHVEGGGCYDPIPLTPRPRPVAIPDRIDLAMERGYFYIHDVYVGTGMEKVERGVVKSLRVVESPEKRSWTQPAWMGSGTQAPGMAWNDFNNKQIIGTAPVEADGSAYFSVPADTFVYFQLLDENGMMVQSMRSGTIARPGETTGCAGCHERRLDSVPNRRRMAFRRPPSKLKPWYGKPRLFNYYTEVQPVFDKYCVRCHDFGKPGAKKVVLAGDLTLSFNVSYMELRRRNLVRVPGAGPPDVMAPYSWGSHASKIVQVLRKGHNKVKLDPEAFDRIVTWIDINAPYYPSYASAYPKNKHGRSPLDNGQLGLLSRLTGVNMGGQSHAARISFSRPEVSPALARLKKTDPKYKQALAIIQAGKKMLLARPRADMPGFKLIGIEAEREARYQERLRAEAKMRQAVVRGKKAYASEDPRRKSGS